MADNNQLEQMKQKYASVLAAVQQQQVQLSHVHIQDNKLFIQGIAPSEQAKNKVWDEIKRVNPNWAQELTADITVDAGSQQTPSASGGSGLTLSNPAIRSPRSAGMFTAIPAPT